VKGTEHNGHWMIHIAAPIFVILSLISGGVGCDDSFEERAARAASNFIDIVLQANVNELGDAHTVFDRVAQGLDFTILSDSPDDMGAELPPKKGEWQHQHLNALISFGGYFLTINLPGNLSDVEVVVTKRLGSPFGVTSDGISMWQLKNGGAIAVRPSAVGPEIWFYSPSRVGNILNMAEDRRLPVLPKNDVVTSTLKNKCVKEDASAILADAFFSRDPGIPNINAGSESCYIALPTEAAVGIRISHWSSPPNMSDGVSSAVTISFFGTYSQLSDARTYTGVEEVLRALGFTDAQALAVELVKPLSEQESVKILKTSGNYAIGWNYSRDPAAASWYTLTVVRRVLACQTGCVTS
jgi:hypothetical protein